MGHKEIKIDASDNPDLARKVFAAAVGAKALPDDMRSGKKIVEDIADEVGVPKSTARRLVNKAMQREIITAGIDQKIARSFDDPLDMRADNGRMPSFAEVMERAGRFGNSTERAEFAAQAIKDGRIKPDQHGGYVIDHGSDEAIKQFIAWAEADPTKIENPQGSVWHKLAAAYQGRRVITARGSNIKPVGPEHDAFLSADPQVFLIQHNWAAAFAGAKDFSDGDAPFPFEHCAFELMVSGRRVIMVTRDVGGAVPSAAIYVDINGAMWIGSKIAPFGEFQTFTDRSSKFNRAVHDSIRALCIALDAEVAVTEVIRAPHRLNHQREKQGKKPILDHHVINLARRSRVEALPSAGEHEVRWHPRLHFRRGHWRHFENHKTWVRWCLVGDPDLGFIDKEYRA